MLYLEEKQKEEALIAVKLLIVRESAETTSEWVEVIKYCECDYLLT